MRRYKYSLKILLGVSFFVQGVDWRSWKYYTKKIFVMDFRFRILQKLCFGLL